MTLFLRKTQLFLTLAAIVSGSACAARRTEVYPLEDTGVGSIVDSGVHPSPGRTDAGVDSGASERDASIITDDVVMALDARPIPLRDAIVPPDRSFFFDVIPFRPDVAPTRDAPPVTGIPCENGAGRSLFRFHFDNSTNPRIDVWTASCSYSLAPGSACNVVPVRSVGVVMSGYAVTVGSADYLRARFSVAGKDFSNATLYVQARSYSTSASTRIRAWSPIYGDAFGGPVDVDFTYDWYAIDWTHMLSPSDDPALTAVQLYAEGGSSSLAIHAVELCID